MDSARELRREIYSKRRWLLMAIQTKPDKIVVFSPYENIRITKFEVIDKACIFAHINNNIYEFTWINGRVDLKCKNLEVYIYESMNSTIISTIQFASACVLPKKSSTLQQFVTNPLFDKNILKHELLKFIF